METNTYLLLIKDEYEPFSCIGPLKTVAKEKAWAYEFIRTTRLPFKALIVKCSSDIASEIENHHFEWFKSVEKEQCLWFKVVNDDEKCTILKK